MRLGSRRQLACLDIIDRRLEARAEQAREHVFILPEAGGEVAGRGAGAQDCNVHRLAP